MSTTHHVKMAKASQKDIDAAIELHQFLRAMSSGRSCPEVVDEFGYKGYEDLLEREASDVEFALRAHERGDLFRVVWGLQVLLDPANEVVDPNLPHLELHPKHEQAATERDAACAENEGLRGLLVAAKDSQLAEREAASAELAAVMQLAVDKWLDDDEGNAATRAARAREAALKAIEAAEAELAAVERQRDELVAAVLPVLDKIEPKPSPFQPLLQALVAAVRAAEQPKPQQPEVQP